MTKANDVTRVADRTNRVVFEYNTAVEDRLVDLIIAGVDKTRIALKRFPDARTEIWVDDAPDSEIRVTVGPGLAFGVACRSMRFGGAET